MRVLTCPRPSFRSGRCRWPGVPPACRTPTFRWTTLFSRALAGVRGRRSPIKKRACDLSRNSNFAPRPDRRARSCRDASVSVDPPRVRLLVNEIEMSAAERLGMFTSSGAHYPAKPECPHAASRTNAGKNKSSQCARVIYLLRQTPLADPASCIFARGEASRWLTSALTRRVPSHVPSSPSLHGAPHSVRGCLIVARRGQQSLAIQSKANGKAGAGAVRNRLFRLEIRTRSSQGISVRRDRIVHQPLKNAGKVHRENGNPKKRGFKAAKKDLLPKNDSLKELLSASAKIPVWRGNNFFGGCNFTFTLKA